ncbi:MAG: mechanosensitive ion channel family protein, partial [Desulfobacterales bacterium]|nr:mechanosensitive ion channel family protein [Desulfobacterales bacterium]
EPAASPETAGRVQEGRYSRMTRLVTRLVILISLAFWLMGIWGIEIPFGPTILRTVFKIFLTLLLAHLAWGFANRLIDRKLAKKKELTETEEHAAEAGEWGAAATQDRSHTLLPIVRKFIGTVLAVMVVLNVISAFGVNIGPLLAGAGILGLAIGFGAQKIVRDILSGFFFLMDDAFRIGEYIQGGKMSGTVEAITLRNVMLRHHRGPLQIVPHSELGSITNYMRGFIVEKFNIELPYDTDIDQVRKVIKTVGQELLEDEEMGPNFIDPLKSQGVRDVTNSVLTFRVKYKAKPGTQFVIRRKAYQRLTESLAKKGIYYAVRKVIVDLPPQERRAPRNDDAHASEKPEPSNRAALLAAGAAAALAVQEAEEAGEKEREQK